MKFVPECYKTEHMCDDAVRISLFYLEYVPHWFVTQQQLKLWHDYNDYCNDDRFIEWYDGYKKRKTQKALIEEELMPIFWHPSRWWDWCIPKDEKRWTENVFLTI